MDRDITKQLLGTIGTGFTDGHQSQDGLGVVPFLVHRDPDAFDRRAGDFPVGLKPERVADDQGDAILVRRMLALTAAAADRRAGDENAGGKILILQRLVASSPHFFADSP